jgi:hypothetical protein
VDLSGDAHEFLQIEIQQPSRAQDRHSVDRRRNPGDELSGQLEMPTPPGLAAPKTRFDASAHVRKIFADE